jgi:hypothetical protein
MVRTTEALPRHIDTVRAVAAGLGIMHIGRFADAYRDAFGETPIADAQPRRLTLVAVTFGQPRRHLGSATPRIATQPLLRRARDR